MVIHTDVLLFICVNRYSLHKICNVNSASGSQVAIDFLNEVYRQEV